MARRSGGDDGRAPGDGHVRRGDERSRLSRPRPRAVRGARGAVRGGGVRHDRSVPRGPASTDVGPDAPVTRLVTRGEPGRVAPVGEVAVGDARGFQVVRVGPASQEAVAARGERRGRVGQDGRGVQTEARQLASRPEGRSKGGAAGADRIYVRRLPRARRPGRQPGIDPRGGHGLSRDAARDARAQPAPPPPEVCDADRGRTRVQRRGIDRDARLLRSHVQLPVLRASRARRHPDHALDRHGVRGVSRGVESGVHQRARSLSMRSS